MQRRGRGQCESSLRPRHPSVQRVKPALPSRGHLGKRGRVVPLWGQVKLRGSYPDDLSLGSQAPDTRTRRFGLALAQRPREGGTPGTALQAGSQGCLPSSQLFLVCSQRLFLGKHLLPELWGIRSLENFFLGMSVGLLTA